MRADCFKIQTIWNLNIEKFSKTRNLPIYDIHVIESINEYSGKGFTYKLKNLERGLRGSGKPGRKRKTNSFSQIQHLSRFTASLFSLHLHSFHFLSLQFYFNIRGFFSFLHTRQGETRKLSRVAQMVWSWDPRRWEVETERGNGGEFHPLGLKMVFLH